MKRLPPIFLALLAGACGSDSISTSVLLQIEAEAGLPQPSELRLWAYSNKGVVKSNELVPSQGPPQLPEEVLIFPPQASGRLRILVRALTSVGTVGEGVTEVAPKEGSQLRATVVIRSRSLPDIDGDGVPDAIDNCPAKPNPEQGPCTSSADAGSPDAGPDPDLAASDTLPDQALDQTSPSDRSPADKPAVCTCDLGCKEGTTDCRTLVPSNGFVAKSYLKVPVIGSSGVLDTTTCVLTAGGNQVMGSLQVGPNSAKACVLAVESMTISTGGTLIASGDYPAVVLVRTSVTIDGLIDVGGKKENPGPGGGGGGNTPPGGPGTPGGGQGGGKVCACTVIANDDCGGGGGGFGTKGGDGGDEDTPCPVISAGGAAYGSSTLVPLASGSGGGSGGQATAAEVAGSGGGGGGALQISCQGAVTIDGVVNAGGGGGSGAPVASTGTGNSAGGGGGSGGGILIEAASIGGSGLLAANGGGGGASSSIACGLGNDGQDGSGTAAAAKGGAAAAPACSNGGDGGWGTSPPKKGAASANGGGGGGGAAGRIRLNWYKHGTTSPVTLSGMSSLGEIIVN